MTKKKKGALLISALALIAVIVVGGTLAYFTSQDTAKNVFTLGKVSGEITETSTPDPDNNIKGGRPTEDGIEYDRVLPGDQLSKEPVVRLKAGSEDAYVRVKLTVENTDAKLTTEQKAELISDACLNFGDDWVVSGDYIYYQKVLSNDVAKGSKVTTPVFTTITIPAATWDNSAAEATFNINITADLVQAENFEPVMTDTQITGWGDVVIKPEKQ